MEEELFFELVKWAVILGGGISGVIFGRPAYQSAKNKLADREADKRRAIVDEAQRAVGGDVNALQTQIQALRAELQGQCQQIADQHTAIEALERWSNKLQEQIADLEAENTELTAALEVERGERKKLEQQIVVLRVDKATLEGQIKAYQQMLEQLLARTTLTGDAPPTTAL